MRDWKQGIPYDKTGDLFRYRVPNEIEIKFIETLLQEERERVVNDMRKKAMLTTTVWKAEYIELISQTISDLTFKDDINYKDVSHLFDFIETLLQESIKARMLELLAFFDDYSHPLEMTAKYVREQIIKFMEDNK